MAVGCAAFLMLPIEILIGKISPSSSPSFLPSDAAVTQKENDDDDDVADDSSDAFIHGQERSSVRHRTAAAEVAFIVPLNGGAAPPVKYERAVIIALIYRIYCRSSMIISMHRHGREGGWVVGA